MINFRKTIAVGLVATTLGMGVATTSTPAAAWGYHHGGWGWGIGGVAAGLALGAARQHALLLRLFWMLLHPPAGRRRLWQYCRLSPHPRLQLDPDPRSQDRFHQFSQQFSPKTSGGAQACLRNVIQIAFGI